MKNRQKERKICRECGREIIEKQESLHVECERCVGQHEEQ